MIRTVVVIVSACLLLLAASGVISAQEPTSTERVVYMPLISSPLLAPQESGTGEGKWYQGGQIHTEWYSFQPHYTLEIAVPEPGSYTCNNLVMWNVLKKEYIPVTEGHWRDYPDQPDIWGPEFFQLTKSWIAAHLVESLRPGYYWAWCTRA